MYCKPVLIAALVIGGISPIASSVGAEGDSVSHPNLLFIMTDQQRFDALSRAGNTILQTPNMDRIAKEGAYFELCYSQCPVCGPARTSLMTGRTVEHTRVRTNMDSDDPDRTLLACYHEILADPGYATEY